MYVQCIGGRMVEQKRSRSRDHPTRYSRCRRIWAKAHRPEMALLMTFELPVEDVGQHRSDYAIISRSSCVWLMERSEALEAKGQQRWRS